MKLVDRVNCFLGALKVAKFKVRSGLPRHVQSLS